MTQLWDMVFNLSLNMLHDFHSAEDAAQSVFEKVIRNRGSFKGDAKFSTWVYRIAYNYLIDIKRKKFPGQITFGDFEKDVSHYEPYNNEFGLNREEEKIYAGEVKVGCTLAMLQCLEPEDRFIYILGNIYCIPGKEASEICGIRSENYRKRLSRSREKIRNFITGNCGLVNPEAFCRCRKRLLIAKEAGRIDLENHLYRTSDPAIKDMIGEMTAAADETEIFRTNPFYLKESLRKSTMIDRLRILRERMPPYPVIKDEK